MLEVFNYLKDSQIFYLATIDADQPRVRPFGAIDVFEDKLYFQTGKVKKVFEQMMHNPRVEICTMGAGGSWIRISATAVRDDRVEARQHMLEANPGLKNMYAADDGNCEVLYLKDATATIYTFGGEPKVIHF